MVEERSFFILAYLFIGLLYALWQSRTFEAGRRKLMEEMDEAHKSIFEDLKLASYIFVYMMIVLFWPYNIVTDFYDWLRGRKWTGF